MSRPKKIPVSKAELSVLPVEGFVRVRQVLAVIPVSAAVWWAGVASGRFPAPVKLGPRTTVWRVDDIRDLIASFERGPAAPGKPKEFAKALN